MIRLKHIAVVVHMGAHESAPANTLPSFQIAIDLGVNCVELDINTTADGHLVVLHGPNVDGATNGTGSVRSLTLAEIRALDAGSRFDPSFAGVQIPTADEAMSLMKGKIDVYIDVKDATPESIVALVTRHDMFSSAIVYGDIESLVAMKLLEPRILAMMPRLPENPADMPALIDRVRSSYFGGKVGGVTIEQINACHDIGAQIYMNTLGPHDNPEGWAQAIADGADGLETDRPTACLKYLRANGLHD
jgi:glycerophosphoryl diester phosphodiesterase